MIVVTTPTGSIGHQVVSLLLAAGEPTRVIARDPSRLAPEVRDRAEVITGSQGDPAVVERAFAGADAVFWLPPPDPRAATLDAGYSELARPAAAAIARHGVARVVGVSALGRGHAREGHRGYVTASHALDDLLAGSASAYRALAMPSFMDNMVRQVEAIRNRGVIVSSIRPDLALPIVATRDIASVAVAQLRDRSWAGGGFAEVPVLGPEDLSHDDLARIMTEVLGTPVRYQQVSTAALLQSMVERGMSPAMAQGRADMMSAKDEGLDLAVARTPALTAMTPTTFRQWCRDMLAPAVRA